MENPVQVREPVLRGQMARIGALGILLALVAAASAQTTTALDRYVAAADPSFRYQLVSERKGQGVTTFVLEMISQTWRSPKEVNRTEWQHWVTIIRPDDVKSSIGLLLIGGGPNTSKPPQAADPLLTTIAVETKTVVGEVRMVPNQPLVFAGDETKSRTEDALIAYTWDKFLRGGDDYWPARLPMTKAAVRAMDALTAFCASAQGGGVKVDRFVVTGASKRGWTAWTTAAVDRRVVAIAPMVIDVLNVEKSLDHHYRAYGFFAPAVRDYQDMHIMDWFGTPQVQALLAIEDPYNYRDRLSMPKFLINAGGDQFFLPDSSQFYFDDLKGEKHLRYVPNADHSLSGSDARESLAAFYESIVKGGSRPKYSWKFENDGSIQVAVVDRPVQVRLWQATNPKARDFRLASIGAAWQSVDLQLSKPNVYVARVRPPAQGWTACFVEMTFPGSGKHLLKFTTAVRVLPGTLPSASYKPVRPVK
jgi:PhoPQ-activated pathogenicity-related protein